MGSVNHELQFLRNNQFSGDLENSEVQALRKERQISRKILVFACTVAVTGFVCLVIGIALLRMNRLDEHISTKPDNNCASNGGETSVITKTTNFTQSCSYSEEFKKSGLLKFVNKLKETFYKLHPYEVPYKPRVSTDEVRKNFKAFNPIPSSIKDITDTSRSLLQELSKLHINIGLLKTREAKALAEMKHFLAHNFGNVYNFDYYSGQWMLGPNRFCYVDVIARLPYHFRMFLKKLSPSTIEDMQTIIEVLKGFGRGIEQYRENIERGVRTGMVGSVEECRVGLDCLTQMYPKIGDSLREEDIMMESFSDPFLTYRFYQRFQKVEGLWSRRENVSLEYSMADSLISYVGIPLVNLMRYLKGDHMKHCVPSNVSSGLFNRPLHYVYYNGIADVSKPASRKLPSGEIIDGKAGYERTMRFFTTTNHTAESVYKLGWSLLESIYPQVLDIAKSVTGFTNESKAVESFRKLVHSPSMFFNEQPFPKNESDERAHRKCNSEKAAREFCPVRYAAMQRWFKFSRSTLSQIEPKLLQMFHWPLGPRKTTPVCPVAIAVNFMPTSSAQTYTTSYRTCKKPAFFRIPFFLDRMGPKYSEWTTSAHEARPGHHLQSQGYVENFLDWCGPVVSVLIKSRYIAYSEGWALYAENPLVAKETDVYNDNPLRRYGMLKWQVWRALRLIVDTGLHFMGMTRDQAIQLFSDYAWDDTDVALKEVTRYQSGPGQATAYMIGQQAFIDMRENAQKKLGSKFDIRDFHFYLLSQGPAPLDYVAKQINNYVECTLNGTSPGCEQFQTSAYERMRFAAGQGYDSELQWDHLEDFYFPPEIHEL